jgi:hypothetical protein
MDALLPNGPNPTFDPKSDCPPGNHCGKNLRWSFAKVHGEEAGRANGTIRRSIPMIYRECGESANIIQSANAHGRSCRPVSTLPLLPVVR